MARDALGRMAPEPIEIRFWRYVTPEPNTGCLIWTGAVATMPVTWLDGRLIGAARVAFYLKHGRFPDGVSRHSCDNGTWCVNPDHVLEGTQAQNIADKVARNRQAKGVGMRGGPRGGAVLTEEQVKEIRARAARGETVYELGAEYGVHPSNIGYVVRRKTWRHIL